MRRYLVQARETLNMYQALYELKADPFRLSPDHAFCFRYPSFTKAKAYMRYALNAAEGFVMVTGRPGMGKTTLISDLLSDLANADDYLTGMLVNTQLEATALLRMVAYEFGLQVQDQDKATVLRNLNQFFIQVSQSKRRPLLVVDEAQNLQLEALEELRLLTNLQFEGRPLLQIFLVGQEELRDKLQDVRLEQLRQRITAACHLDPLTVEQTTAYILHRLRVVGWTGVPKVTAATFRIIQQISQGIPRRINQFCSRLLLHGALEEKLELTPEDAKLVVRELDEEHLSPVAPNHDLLSGVSTPNSESGDSESSVADESLLKTAEALLRQQEKTVKKPAPAAARTATAGAQDIRKPDNPRPVVPILEEPQVIEPKAARSRRKAKDKAENPADDQLSTPSKWPIFAYTMVIVLVMAVPFFAVPNHYLEKWFPDRLWAMLNTLPFAKTDVEPRSRSPADKPEPRVRQPGADSDPGASARREFRSNPGPFNASIQKPAPGPVPTAIANDLPLPRTHTRKTAQPVTLEHGEPRPHLVKVVADRRTDYATHKPSQQQPAGPETTRTASGPAPVLAPENPPSTDREIETKSQPQDRVTPKPQPAQLAAIAKPKEPEVHGNPPGDDASPTADRSGAPDPRPLMVREVSFGFDSTEIRPRDRSLLDAVATSMKASNQWMAHIVGYTDSVGSKKYNQHLSQLRANVVAAYLSRQGISYNRLRIEGRGSFEHLPYADNETPAQPSARLVRIVLEPSD